MLFLTRLVIHIDAMGAKCWPTSPSLFFHSVDFIFHPVTVNFDLMTLTFKPDLDGVKMKHCAKCLDQRSFCSRVIVSGFSVGTTKVIDNSYLYVVY